MSDGENEDMWFSRSLDSIGKLRLIHLAREVGGEETQRQHAVTVELVVNTRNQERVAALLLSPSHL